jgi:hypothetical protein
VGGVRGRGSGGGGGWKRGRKNNGALILCKFFFTLERHDFIFTITTNYFLMTYNDCIFKARTPKTVPV